MSVKVMIPSALRQFAGGQDTIELDGPDVGSVLQKLTEGYPDLKPHLLGDDGTLRNFVNVFVNDENIRDMQKQDTPLGIGDEVLIVPAVAGGKESGCRGSGCRGLDPSAVTSAHGA
jgi:molybdopterin converting factor small subunit